VVEFDHFKSQDGLSGFGAGDWKVVLWVVWVDGGAGWDFGREYISPTGKYVNNSW